MTVEGQEVGRKDLILGRISFCCLGLVKVNYGMKKLLGVGPSGILMNAWG